MASPTICAGERFDAQVLAQIGIDPAILPPLARCEEIIGAVTEAAAAATGLAAGTPVAAGQVDFNASCVAAGIIEPGDIMSNLGTVGNFGVVHKSREFNFSPVGLSMINFAFTVDSANTYVTVPSTTTGGQSIRYLRDTFSQWEVETERVLGITSYDLLNMQAEKTPPGSRRADHSALPHGRTHAYLGRPGAWRGLWSLPQPHQRAPGAGHDGSGGLCDLRLLSAHQQIRPKINFPMVLNEGGAVSKLWRQIITDVFAVPRCWSSGAPAHPLAMPSWPGSPRVCSRTFGVAKEWAEYH